MPGGVQIFAQALGMSELEMFKLMEQGKLLATDVLPKVAVQMKKMAKEGGALDAKLNSVRVTQGQFNTALQLGQDTIFNSGYNKGLANLFKTLTGELNENGETLKRIGKIYEKVFNGIAVVVEVASKWLEVFIRSIESVYRFGKDNPFTAMAIGATSLLLALKAMPGLLKVIGSALVRAFSGPLAVLTSIMAIIDEIRAAFDANVIGVGENENASQEDRDLTAAAFAVNMGRGTKEQKALLAKTSQERLAQAQANAGGIPAVLGSFGASRDQIQQNVTKTVANQIGVPELATTANTFNVNKDMLARVIKAISGMDNAFTDIIANPLAGLMTGANYLSGDTKPIVVNQSIVVQGNMTEDNAKQIKREIENISSLQTVGAR